MLSRIDGTFLNLLIAEARDFHCHSHVLENFGERSIPSDHAAVRVIQKPTIREPGQTYSILDVQTPFFCSLWKHISNEHIHSDDPFAALAEFKNLEKARKRTETLGSLGAKLLTASTASRVYSNRLLGTLMLCIEAWEQNIASLAWIAPGQSAYSVFAIGAPRNQCSAFTPLLMKTVTLLKTKTNLAGGYVNIGVQSLWRALKAKHHCHETLLRYLQKAPDDILWEIDGNEFDELMATERKSAREA